MYRYSEFPRVVYGPDGASMVINNEDERPDGYVNDPAGVDTTSAEAKEAAAAAKEAKEAEAKLRAGYKEFLDEYHVSYAKNLSTDKLGDLVEQLKAHLEAQSAPVTQEPATDDDGNADH